MGRLLSYDESPLLREVMQGRRFDAWEYFGDGAFPHHRAQKDEVERLVAETISGWDESALAEALERNAQYLIDWVPKRLEAATSNDELARLAGFAELQRLVEDSRAALDLDALGYPRADQPVAIELPELWAEHSRDGLVRVRAENVTDAGGSEQVFCRGDTAIYPHPELRPLRELLFVLADLASDPTLEVWIALDPYRVGLLSAVQPVLLADQWSGIELTQANLDSLDAHDIGVESFHAAVSRSEDVELLHPLVATRVTWTARRDDAQDKVKSLYIRELRPSKNSWGESLDAVYNRELHSERDTEGHLFTHIDGKVKRYPATTYASSRETPRGPTGAASHSRKLWRVDGSMSDEQWCALAGLHFRHNELIAEHFREVFPSMRQID